MLPALELVYVWNLFKVIGQQRKLIEPIYVLVEATEKKLMKHKGKTLKAIKLLFD